MEVKDVVKRAKSYLLELIADETPSNIGLEEIEYDRNAQVWNVTLGFSRPWNSTRSPLTALSGEPATKRAYRVFEINDADGDVLSMKRREFND
jgi:hypothetical protein